MATTPEELARIRREIDAETSRRIALAGYARCPMGQKDEYVRSEPLAPEPVQAADPRPREAAAMSAEASAAWNAWARAAIDRRVEDIYIPAIGAALAKKAKEIRDEMLALAEEVGSATGEADRRIAALEAELADFRTAFAEVRARLAESEVQPSRGATDDKHKAAPLALPPPGWVGTA